jgi:arylsulfatase A-like enzyme
MKNRYFSTVCLLMLGLFCGSNLSSAQTAEQGRPPNILLILIDDLGWKDLGYAGSDYYYTPNIDRLAAESVVFVNGYANSPVCSPSRGAILTGTNPAATQFTCVFGNHVPVGDQLFPVSRPMGANHNQTSEAMHRHAVPREFPTIADVLKAGGYRTGFFGKWHCGTGPGFYPQDRGFEVAKGYRQRHGSTRGHYVHSFNGNLTGMEAYDSTAYISEALTDACIRFLGAPNEAPFFAVLSHYLVHRPLQPLPKWLDFYKNRKSDDQEIAAYAAMVSSVDESVGQIMDALDSLGLAENTLVVFTSDNGGLVPKSTSNYPLLGGKSFPFEAGTRVPLLVRWPGYSTTQKSEERVLGSDLFATFFEAAFGRITDQLPAGSRSLLPVLKGEKLAPRPLIFHFPHYTHATGPYSSIIESDWKLIRFYNDEAGRFLLFNLSEDPYEEENLADLHPAKVRALDAKLQQALRGMQAEFPLPNAAYTEGSPDNKNLEFSLKLAEKERAIMINRLRQKGMPEKIVTHEK